MDIRVAAYEKRHYPVVCIAPETQQELMRNMEYSLHGGFKGFEEYVMSHFTDIQGNRVMLLMQSFQGIDTTPFSSDRSIQEFTKKISERFQTLERAPDDNFMMFNKGKQYFQWYACGSCYNLVQF